jgi:hypothetical protein
VAAQQEPKVQPTSAAQQHGPSRSPTPTHLPLRLRKKLGRRRPHPFLAQGGHHDAVACFSSPWQLLRVRRRDEARPAHYKSREMSTGPNSFPLCSISAPIRNPGRPGHLQSPPVETSPGQAVTTTVIADLDMAIVQKESSPSDP